MYWATVGSVISIPSLSNSPWRRGAPQRGLFRLIIRIRSRTSCGTRGRPGWPRRILHLQNQRKPFRCQATTVSAWTIMRADFQSVHTRDRRASASAVWEPSAAARRVVAVRRGSPAGAEPSFGTARRGYPAQYTDLATKTRGADRIRSTSMVTDRLQYFGGTMDQKEEYPYYTRKACSRTADKTAFIA